VDQGDVIQGNTEGQEEGRREVEKDGEVEEKKEGGIPGCLLSK
jgi:hypothetical protein